VCPVTAKLSLKFYERFGDDIAMSLWTDSIVDATYRSGLRELRDLNYARFDAKLEQRVAELRADIPLGLKRLEARLTKRLFGFWIAQAATTVGLVFGVVKILQ
jgi:glutathione S-transferase